MSTLQQKKNGLITGIYSIKCNSISTLSRPTVVCFVFFLFEIFLLPFYVHWIQLVDVCGPGFRNFTNLVSILFCLFFFPDDKQNYLLPFVLTWTWGRLFYLWRRNSGTVRAAWRRRSCWRWGRRPGGRRWRAPTASPGSGPTPQSCSWTQHTTRSHHRSSRKNWRTIHTWDLLRVNNSLNNGLYCTKRTHSHLLFGQLLPGLVYPFLHWKYWKVCAIDYA